MFSTRLFRIGLAVLLLVLLGGIVASCAPSYTPQPSPTPSPTPTPTPTPTPPPPPTPTPPPPPQPQAKPDIKAVATIPQGNTIPFGNTFTAFIMVNNYGNAPAQNLHLYVRANPPGYFAVLGCDRPYSPLAPAGMDISLGDLYPGAGTQIRINLRAPTQAQVGGQQGMNFEFSFTYDYYGGSGYAGRMVFSVGSGVVLLVPK